MSTLRIGVIGTGAIAASHLDAYARNSRVEVVALCDLNADRVAAVAEKRGIPRHYSDPAAFFADDGIDAVSVCTWNNTHAALATAAVEAGKHVLVEKPMTRTYAEALELQRTAESRDRIVQIGYVRRHSTNCRVLKSFIDAGDLGDIYYAKASSLQRLGNPGGWFADRSISGGGPMIDIGIHVLDLCWYLMGRPKATTVSANTYHELGSRPSVIGLSRWQVSSADGAVSDVEDMANALIRFDNGASLMVDASYSLHIAENSLRVAVFGNAGGAELEPQLRLVTEQHSTILNSTPQLSSGSFEGIDGFDHEIENFVSTCLGETTSVAPLSDGVEMMRMLDAVYRSAEQHREVTLEDAGAA